MNNNNLVGIAIRENFGYSLEEFIQHCKGNYKEGNIKELLNDLESDWMRYVMMPLLTFELWTLVMFVFGFAINAILLGMVIKWYLDIEKR